MMKLSAHFPFGMVTSPFYSESSRSRTLGQNLGGGRQSWGRRVAGHLRPVSHTDRGGTSDSADLFSRPGVWPGTAAGRGFAPNHGFGPRGESSIGEGVTSGGRTPAAGPR